MWLQPWRRRPDRHRRGEQRALVHQEMLDDRAERQRREERQRADDEDGADEQAHEEGPCVGNVPLVTGIAFLAARLPAAASSGSRNRKRPTSIASPSVRLYQGVFAVMPANALPLLPVPLV